MAQRLAAGFPFPIYVNETATAQRLAPGVYLNETATRAILQDCSVVSEYSALQQSTAPTYQERLTLARQDTGAILEAATAVRQDSELLLDGLRAILTDANTAIEKTGRLGEDGGLALEFLGAPTFAITGDAGLLIEWAVSACAGSLTAMESSLRIFGDVPARLETSVAISLDSEEHLEAAVSTFSDLDATLEWVATLPMRRLVVFIRGLRR